MFLRWRGKRNFGINTQLNINTGATGAPREYLLIWHVFLFFTYPTHIPYPYIYRYAFTLFHSWCVQCACNKNIAKTFRHWNRIEIATESRVKVKKKKMKKGMRLEETNTHRKKVKEEKRTDRKLKYKSEEVQRISRIVTWNGPNVTGNIDRKRMPKEKLLPFFFSTQKLFIYLYSQCIQTCICHCRSLFHGAKVTHMAITSI